MHRFKSIIFTLGILSLLTQQQCCAKVKTWQEHIDAAHRAYCKGDYTEAVNESSKAVKDAERFAPDDPRLAVSLNYLARSYSHGNLNRTKVVSLCIRSIAITESIKGRSHPDLLTPLHLLTETYVLDDKFKLADSSLRRALKIDNALTYSNSPDAAKRKLLAASQLNLIGIFYWARNHLSQAEGVYSAAIRLNPNSSVLFINRGRARCILNNKKGAEADFAEAKRLGLPNKEPV